MKKAFFAIALLCAFLLLTGCGDNYADDVSYAMGSTVTQKIFGGSNDTKLKVRDAIMALENEISYRKNDSLVYRLDSGETVSDEDLVRLLESAVALSEETDGVYDITVLPVVLLWGFDGDTSSYRLPTENEIAKLLSKVDYRSIKIENGKAHLENGAACDLSAVGKGEACGKAVEIYKADGVTGAIITVGGSVGVYGKKDDGSLFTVGVRDPFSKNDLIGTLKLTDKFISTSGSYEKYFTQNGKQYHHLLDATTGYPAETGLVSVTVVCDDGGESDSLASACFCVGMEKSLEILKNHSADAVFITNDGKIYITPGLDGIFDAEAFEVIGK